MDNLYQGLTEKEAWQSRKMYGENRLNRRRRKSFWGSFLESFGDPMIKILLAALAVNIIFLFKDANWFESAGIAFAILLATFVSTLSEYGSESAFEKLQEEASRILCRVVREGITKEIALQEVCVGDIITLQAGDRVPADGILLTGKLEVDQSSLNGESKEAAKRPSGNPPEAGGADFNHPALLFSGSVVCAGEGLMRVRAVGDKTVYGSIGKELQGDKGASPLKLRLRDLAKSIGTFGYAAALLTILAYFFNVIFLDNRFDTARILATVTNIKGIAGHFLKAASLAVTVVVMAVPEGLPMMITVVLSANMNRMLKDNVLVRKLVGIETAGSMNILFADKTGTLTQGKLNVTHFVSGTGRVWAKKDILALPTGLRSVLHDAIYYNCQAKLPENGRTAIGGNATDRAALEFASSLGCRPKQSKVKDVLPFSGETKFMATAATGGWNVTFIKGAPEKILPFCTGYYGDAGETVQRLLKNPLEAAIKRLSDQAMRIIAIAVSDAPVRSGGAFGHLRLVGLLGIRDEIRGEAYDGVKQVCEAGIQTVMITGDSRQTALAIAKEVGIVRHKTDIVITSQELSVMTDTELKEKLPDLRVVARALPADKSRLVRAAKDMGLVTGMTGDGVNDAPALKQADVGFAMGSGTEVAKEAGDIVILNDNISSIAKAVCYGRTIFKSIRKFIIYQLSICMCAVGVTVAGPLVGVDMPITVIQMLWINIVMDTLAGLAFSGEIARKKYMEEPPKSLKEPIINSYMIWQIATVSCYTSALCLFFLKSPVIHELLSHHGGVYMMTAFFALFMFSAIFISFCARTHRVNLFDYLAANKPFLWIMGAVTVIQVFIVYCGGPVFRTAGLEPLHLLIVVALAFTIIPVDLLRKAILKRVKGKGKYAGT
ncbi:MAG: calcium-translocating P-type ATPase, PMCA-type [Clostridiales bacterium]|jgi:calcium-translocating P-type ATPase|nr:calcium-translocating P-type ATPase, PMCA-type [Clostridiales bacterium]